MAFSYERYDRQQRRGRAPGSTNSILGYWVPLGLTVATATIGFAAWIWKERNDSDRDDSDDSDDTRNVLESEYAERRKEDARDLQRATGQTTSTLAGAVASDYRGDRGENVEERGAVEQDSIVSRMSGALRRTPSPQQIFDGASRRVAAGVAAAGVMVGRGLTAIRETDDDFQDHQRWSGDNDDQNQRNVVLSTSEGAGRPSSRAIPTQAGVKRKSVAIVVSAEGGSSPWQESGQAYEVEHASIISHIPKDVNHETVDLMVLIYAPHLQSYPLNAPALLRNKQRTGSSTTSSYSNISTPAGDDESVMEVDPGATNASYESLQMSALRIVSHPTRVLPFTTPTGHVHLLRHLCPSLVYMEESLTGLDGDHVREIESWVGQIVVVIGGEGLVDTETEDEGAGDAADKHWWKDSNRVGLGKAEIVDSSRVTEDWMKRIG